MNHNDNDNDNDSERISRMVIDKLNQWNKHALWLPEEIDLAVQKRSGFRPLVILY